MVVRTPVLGGRPRSRPPLLPDSPGQVLLPIASRSRLIGRRETGRRAGTLIRDEPGRGTFGRGLYRTARASRPTDALGGTQAASLRMVGTLATAGTKERSQYAALPVRRPGGPCRAGRGTYRSARAHARASWLLDDCQRHRVLGAPISSYSSRTRIDVAPDDPAVRSAALIASVARTCRG